MSLVKADLKSKEGFYVGDLCYVFGKKLYDEFWGDEKDYEDGEYTFDGMDFVVCGTGLGDGCYTDQNGHEYSVDAGIIGAAPLELIRKYGKEDEEFDPVYMDSLGHVVKGDTMAFTADYMPDGTLYEIEVEKDGRFVEDITIDCMGHEDEDDYEDDYEDEEEDEEEEE